MDQLTQPHPNSFEGALVGPNVIGQKPDIEVMGGRSQAAESSGLLGGTEESWHPMVDFLIDQSDLPDSPEWTDFQMSSDRPNGGQPETRPEPPPQRGNGGQSPETSPSGPNGGQDDSNK